MSHTVLVVDDEPHVIRLVEINLTQLGFKVRSAPDGEQALAPRVDRHRRRDDPLHDRVQEGHGASGDDNCTGPVSA